MIKLLAFALVFAPAVFAQVGLELFPQPFPPLGGCTAVIDGSLVRQYPNVNNGYSIDWKPAHDKLQPSRETRERCRKLGKDAAGCTMTSWFNIGFGCWGALLTCKGAGSGVGCCIELKPDWGELKLSTQMRATDLVPGGADWCDGRLTLQFVDGSGKIVGNRPDVFRLEGTTPWITCERVYPIPPDAVRVNVGLCNFGQSGKVEFRPVSLKVHSLRQPRK